MTNYEMLLKTSDAAAQAHEDGFENFAKALEEIASRLLQEIETENELEAT